ncbi:MAG: flavodoxin domain-containing protein, partial [Vogesella sp.]|uniref:flavodoxin domain-containing protein n=1 Tax=Vogesella sp. TaxID=1904252 RepID=UPI003F36E46F
MMEQARLIWAAGLGLAYAGVCVAAWHQWRRSRQAATVAAPLLVVYAGQSGQAEAVAQQTVATLQAAGVQVQCLSLAQLDITALQQASRLLLVASTAGEGEPPDMARRFAANLAQPAALAGLQYAVLALGDRRYAQFCAFGRALDGWLADSGAQPLYPRID